MKTPLILITYGLSQKLCTWEEDGVHRLPLFNEPALATLFLKAFNEHMGELLEDKEPPQIQVCESPQYALDMVKMLGIVAPDITIVYNAAPIGEDPHAAIAEISGQFQEAATTINKYYDLEEATEIFQDLVESSAPIGADPDGNGKLLSDESSE